MAEQLQFSFNMQKAKAYMQTMFHLEAQREELNDAINDARSTAREAGVPTKAVEASIKAAKGRRKSALRPAEFQALMDAAEALLPQEERDTKTRREEVWEAGKALHPDMFEGVEAVTFATEDQEATVRRTHHA